MFKTFFKKINKDLAVDLGTKNTIICSPEDGILVNEPSVIAVNTRTDEILAIGKDACGMFGKSPDYIKIIEPFERGIISDFEAAEKLLKHFFNKAYGENLNFSPRPRVAVNVPLGITEVEKKAIEDVVEATGTRKIHLIDSIISAAIGARFPVLSSKSCMIVNLGGGTLEIAVIALGGIVISKTVKISGSDLDNDIVQFIRGEFNVLIGVQLAEKLKISLGSVLPLKDSIETKVRGKNLITGLPSEIVITDTHIRAATRKSFAKIIESIISTLEITPPELVNDIYESGIILTGGVSLSRMLDKRIAQASKMPVKVVDDPITCNARGAALFLENDELLKKASLVSTRR